jgi:hypothetical protein
MLRAWSGMLAVALLGAMATSAQAQSFFTPLNGDWILNIPQEPYGPAVWTLKEEKGLVTGTTEINDVPGANITGELSGERFLSVFYVLNSDFEIDFGVPDGSPTPATNVAVIVVFRGRVQGFAISTIDGVPFAAYEVLGHKL